MLTSTPARRAQHYGKTGESRCCGESGAAAAPRLGVWLTSDRSVHDRAVFQLYRHSLARQLHQKPSRMQQKKPTKSAQFTTGRKQRRDHCLGSTMSTAQISQGVTNSEIRTREMLENKKTTGRLTCRSEQQTTHPSHLTSFMMPASLATWRCL